MAIKLGVPRQEEARRWNSREDKTRNACGGINVSGPQ